MMKLLGSLAQISFDGNAASQDLDKALKATLLEATKLWVRTVVSIVPTWSGMSQGSIRSIADKVGEPVNDNPIAGNFDSRGRLRVPPSRSGIGFGDATYNDAAPRYFFRWSTAVPHFIFNESNNANDFGFHLRRPGPYHSQTIAGEIFKSVVKQRLKNLDIRLKDHIKVTQKTFGG